MNLVPFAQQSPEDALAMATGTLGMAMDMVNQYALPVLGAVVILIIGWVVAGWVRKLVVGRLEKAGVDKAISHFLGRMSRLGIIVLTLLACATTIGIEVTSFVAVLASAAFAVGLALQGTLSHFAAGVMLLIFRPFTVGDFVNAGGETGSVHNIDLFATTLTSLDNRRITIPNSAIWGNTITNFGAMGTRRADIDVGVAYGADLKQVEEVCRKAAESVETVLDDPAIGFAFTEMAASSLNFKLMVWCNASDYLPTLHNVRSAVYNALNDADIEIPFNQIVVHQAPAED